MSEDRTLSFSIPPEQIMCVQVTKGGGEPPQKKFANFMSSPSLAPFSTKPMAKRDDSLQGSVNTG